MDFYSSEFSPEARDRIEKEKIRAYRELLPRSVYDFKEQDLAVRCIMRIFLAFAKEARALRKERGWTIERVERESGEFLRRLTIMVLYDKFPDLKWWISNSDGSIDPDVQRRFRETDEWKEYEELLLASTNAAPSKSSNAAAVPLSPVPFTFMSPFMSNPPFKSDEEWREYQRQHDPEGYERWKKDHEQARLARLKEENYEQWAAASTSDQLRKELLSRESQRIALEREKRELIGRARWPLQGPLGKQYPDVIYYIDVLKAELIRRGEALDTVESKSTDAADNTRGAFVRAILDKKGFSVHDWAKRAGVDFHTADKYLKGKTKPFPNTRKKLADGLDIKVEELPE